MMKNDDSKRNEEDQEAARFEAARLDFLDWLNAERRRAENNVRALFSRLKEGVPVQVIDAEVNSALYWKEIPDEWAERYAEDYTERQVLYEAVATFIDKYQFFIDLQPETWGED